MHAAMTPAMTTPTTSIFLLLRTAGVCAPASQSYAGKAICYFWLPFSGVFDCSLKAADSDFQLESSSCSDSESEA